MYKKRSPLYAFLFNDTIPLPYSGMKVSTMELVGVVATSAAVGVILAAIFSAL
jgi:hypothetical protein